MTGGKIWTKRIVAALCVALAVTGAGLAAAYDDFTRGMSAVAGGKFDAAIAAFTAALDAGDLAPAYVSTAHFGRARAYMGKGMCAEALPDVEAAMKESPGADDMIGLHMAVNVCLNNDDAVERDYEVLIAKNPSAVQYDGMARLMWRKQQWGRAAELFRLAWDKGEKDPRYRSYTAIWYAISAMRAGASDPAFLEKAADASDDWPEAILKFFLGKLDEAALYRAAQAREEKRANEQICEADFYLAEWRLIHGDVPGAKPLLQKALAECPKTFVEYEGATVELERLH